MSYAEYLQSPIWQLLRRLKLEEARNACSLCASKIHLQVHHRDYQRCYGRERLSDLTVLCAECHEKYTKSRPIEPIPVTKFIPWEGVGTPEVREINRKMRENQEKMVIAQNAGENVRSYLETHQRLLNERKALTK